MYENANHIESIKKQDEYSHLVKLIIGKFS
jgi:hypothetical protein